MKFSVILSEFAKVLNDVLPAIPRKSTLPILEHLHFTLSANSLRIVATDQEIIIKSEITVEGTEDGEILVPAKRLSEIVKVLDQAGTIEFISNPENHEITLKTQSGKYTMLGLDADEYIDLPEIFGEETEAIDGRPEVHTAHFTAADMQRLTNLTSFAVSTDEFRLAMTGILFQFRGNYVYSVATDSFRLVRITAFASEEQPFPEDFDVIIPTRAIEILKKVNTNITMTSIANEDKVTHLRFIIGNLVFITRVINERFPPYETVIPTGNELTMVTSRKEFLAAIKRVSIFTSNVSHQIRMNLSNDSFVLGGEDESTNSNASETLPCDFNGEAITIGFNVKYLDDAISHLEPATEGDDNIYLFISEPTKPILINTEPNSQRSLMLLMPVRLNATATY